MTGAENSDGAQGSRHLIWRCRTGVGTRPPANYRVVIATDVVSFGTRYRDDNVQLHIRKSMYELVKASLDAIGVPWGRCHHEDRGDGVFIVAPPRLPVGVFLDPLADQLYAMVRIHNEISTPANHMQIRAAVHAGQVHFDHYGVAGRTVLHLFRLLEAPAFKNVLVANDVSCGVIVSDHIRSTMVDRRCRLIDPTTYTPIEVHFKEVQTTGWIRLP